MDLCPSRIWSPLLENCNAQTSYCGFCRGCFLGPRRLTSKVRRGFRAQASSPTFFCFVVVVFVVVVVVVVVVLVVLAILVMVVVGGSCGSCCGCGWWLCLVVVVGCCGWLLWLVVVVGCCG